MVKVVFRCVVVGRCQGRIVGARVAGVRWNFTVATGAKSVVVVEEFEGVWIVAVFALHTGVVHLRLQERTVDVHFLQDLPIWIVQPGEYEFGEEVIQEGAPVGVFGGHTTTP